ncbi:RES family NAD+ phosphorylase [Microbulbifer agarilyticus]|uniref:RES family NAD+ phosphorylase n=1 Tax=Microbulbifer agarilyticus TaxID=260552 RepID=UPI001CD24032|nr:RES family NAD+ phosphorylase [Microbulbifer agarilyticus]MCA0901393.1 RES family NAD+ phosphorylase [Microbulbifer agarilyticus]
MDDLRGKIRESAVRLLGRLYRIIESQEEVATRSLVDSLQKQEILENLLEQSKPVRLPGSEQLHYLLATPFRYPPLPWGSRFGGIAESGIFYGSKTIDTVLIEAAYYRLLFINDMVEAPMAPVTSFHQIFSAKYCADPGVRLQAETWRHHWPQLTHHSQYSFCQTLGAQLRESNVQGVEAFSARALMAGICELPQTGGGAGGEGINVALFDPAALLPRAPTIEAEVTAETTTDGVSFLVKSGNSVRTTTFNKSVFLASGTLPLPA